MNKYILFFIMLSSQMLLAISSTLYEKEPNNTPMKATSFQGDIVLRGSIDNTDQDAYSWSINEADSSYNWNIELIGVPNAMTRIDLLKINFSADGKKVVGYHKFFSFGTRTGTKPINLRNVILDKGKYLLAVTSKSKNSSSKSYKIKITKNSKTYSKIKESSKDNTTNSSIRYYNDYKFYHYKFEDTYGWFSFEVSKEDSKKIWKINAINTIGHKTNLILYDEANVIVANVSSNKFGKTKMENLELDEGKYYLKYSGDVKGLNYGVKIHSVGNVPIDEQEVEPNDSKSEANRINYKKTIYGKIDKASEYDYFTFSIPKKYEDKLFDIKLNIEDKDAYFYLYSPEDKELHEKRGDSNHSMSNLRFSSRDEYKLAIYSRKKDLKYNFKFSEPREAILNSEVEPNDNLKNACAVVTEESIKGDLLGSEYDCFSFTIDKANRIWSITANGETVKNMELFKEVSSNRKLLSSYRDKNHQLAFRNLLLLPGSYGLCLYGTNSDYAFSINESKLSDINISSLDELEHEANQNKSQTNALAIGKSIKGIVENDSNSDFFHFTLKNNEHIKVTLKSPKDGNIRFFIESDLVRAYGYMDENRNAIVEGIYPQGRYIIEVWAEEPSYGLYDLKVERLNYFESMDVEPNGKYNIANVIPTTFNMEGKTGARDEDYFKFPDYMTKETNLSISGLSLKNNIRIYSNFGEDRVDLEWNDENKTYSAKLLSPNSSYIIVDNDANSYDYNLSFTKYNATIVKELELSLKVNTENDEVATYSQDGQRVKFYVTLESLNDLNLDVTSHISDATWSLDYNSSLTIETNKKLRVPFELTIPKNISSTTVATTLKFADKNANYKTISFNITPKNNAKPINPYNDWGLPLEMLGGLNVARFDFGAKRVVEHNETEIGYAKGIMVREHQLFDNITYKGNGFHLYSRRDKADENVTVELAGNSVVEVAGVILNTVGYGNKHHRLKDFSISLSSDGSKFTHIYSETLGLESKDQAFAFDKSYKAKYARLTLHNNYSNETKGDTSLGEFKVIAKADSIINIEKFNIANPTLGGHVIKASQILSSGWDKNILSSKDGISTPRLYKSKKNLSWVVGFKNERVAKVTNMKWIEPLNIDKNKYMKNIKLFVSTQTPNGPWHKINNWVKSDNNTSSYNFNKPTWARYIKFVFDIPKDASYALPQELQIYEEKTSNNYRSILGEWGETSHRSYYEYLQDGTKEKIEVITGNEKRENAYNLKTNEDVKGRVSVANDEEDWYKITIPQKRNQIRLSLLGKDSVDVKYELFNDKGFKVEPSNSIKEPLVEKYIFDVKEGASYFVRVKQPPVSVVFAWDNSGSVSSYHQKIFNAVNNYTQTIKPKIDAVNLMCFNSKDKFLLEDFSDKPTEIQTIFSSFSRDCASSDAERPLRKASEVLKHRDGTKGVIIIGDGVGSRDKKLWGWLKDVRTKVFSIRVQSQYKNNEIYEGVMQSWSRVNNGTYSVVSNGVEIYKAINRASAILRRPVYYNLNIQSRYEKPIGPGTLELKFDSKQKVPVSKNFAVELILDASGSMLKRIGGKRRIAIAGDVLKKAVKEIIPAKTMVALRVFGHKKADSCRTDLEVKLQPLNPHRMSRVIGNIKAKNLAKTPIADSLNMVADDLKSINGKKVVILVTDGKETCDGDPAKVIESLKEQGIDIRVNIVGFAIDNKELKAEFKRWAELGNGAYFDAKDKHSLSSAIKKALQVPYSVYDSQNRLVAKGVVGEKSITLNAGKYKVVIDGAEYQVYDGIVIKGEKNNVVVLQQGS